MWCQSEVRLGLTAIYFTFLKEIEVLMLDTRYFYKAWFSEDKGYVIWIGTRIMQRHAAFFANLILMIVVGMSGSDKTEKWKFKL